MSKLREFLFNRLGENSTWRAIVGALTAFGVTLSPEQTELIVGAGVALYLAIEAFLPDNLKEKKGDAEAIESADPTDPDVLLDEFVPPDYVLDEPKAKVGLHDDEPDVVSTAKGNFGGTA